MILLTGATGKTGGETAKALAARGVKARVLVRDPAKGAALQALGHEIAVGDASDAASVKKALAGVERILILLPNSQQQEAMEKQLTDLAKQSGVKHVVKMSSMEAMASATTPIPMAHWAVEEHIRRSGLAWTMVKPNFFMQNLLGSAGSIKANKSFSLPFGNGRTAMMDARDIGAATAEVLAGKGHENRSYEITGPELLTFHEAAERFSAALGTKITYVPADPAVFMEIMKKVLPNEWHRNAVGQLFREIAEGGLNHTTQDFRKLTGRDPISLTQFVRDHAQLFQ
ncbi:MAG: SDR family oxidoreductase [Gammaproteobacteria bacterium]|nr:SDR family oxidoreductase [Gammaproteobacteria bacterium]